MSDLNDTIRGLSDAELTVMVQENAAKAHAARERRPRLAAMWHALVVELAEEQDRRRGVFEATVRDVAGEDVGGLVADVDTAIAEARRQLREGF